MTTEFWECIFVSFFSVDFSWLDDFTFVTMFIYYCVSKSTGVWTGCIGARI